MRMTIHEGNPTLAESQGLVTLTPPQPDRHPSAVCLAGLASGSRRTMRQALDTVAALLTGGRADAETLDWSALRYQHTAAVRAVIAERYAPATVNKILAAMRGVLRQAWRLGYMTAEDYRRAADLTPVRGSTLPRGRALTMGELRALFAAATLEQPHPTTQARDSALLAVLYSRNPRRRIATSRFTDGGVSVPSSIRRRAYAKRSAVASDATARSPSKCRSKCLCTPRFWSGSERLLLTT